MEVNRTLIELFLSGISMFHVSYMCQTCRCIVFFESLSSMFARCTVRRPSSRVLVEPDGQIPLNRSHGEKSCSMIRAPKFARPVCSDGQVREKFLKVTAMFALPI
jgi:hypothetical protein